MRKIGLAVLVLGMLLCAGNAFGAKTLTISTGNWVPWSGSDLPYGGFVNHVVQEAFSRAGYDVQFNYYPWERAYQTMIKCRVDASSFWYESEKRREKAYYSEPVSEEEYVFFYHQDNPMADWKKLEDLQNYAIGVSHGTTYTDELWQLAEKGVLNLDKAKNDLTNFKKLVRKRIDIFPTTRLQGKKLLRENFDQETIDKIKIHPKPLKVVTGHLLFPKCNPDSQKYLKDFNKGLAEMKQDGTLKKIKQGLHAGEYSN